MCRVGRIVRQGEILWRYRRCNEFQDRCHFPEISLEKNDHKN